MFLPHVPWPPPCQILLPTTDISCIDAAGYRQYLGPGGRRAWGSGSDVLHGESSKRLATPRNTKGSDVSYNGRERLMRWLGTGTGASGTLHPNAEQTGFKLLSAS